MRRRFSELVLGMRFALTGGSDARLRAGLTAAGVALGVALLMFAASTPSMIQSHNARVQARQANVASGHARLYELDGGTTFHGQAVSVMTLQAIAAQPPIPPGLSRIPAPGEMYVSPALDRILHSARGSELAQRLHARVVGLIGQRGLSGPAELYAYRGASGLRARDSLAISQFGSPPSGTAEGTVITLLIIVMVIALLLPVGVFVATASHFGSERRNERLAAVRLLGADRMTTARIAAGEALFGALSGVAAGLLLFALIIRPVVPYVDIAGISVFESDVKPSLWLAVLVILLVPAASVLFALLTMRQVAIEPLGVTRHAQAAGRRVWWRLLTPLIGLLLLLPLVGHSQRLDGTGGEIEASTGIVLMLVGVCALLPWLVEAAVIRAQRGPLSWLLAMRRLRADHGTSGRVVSAVALTVAGTIALQAIFSAAQTRADSPGPNNPAVSRDQASWYSVDLYMDHADATAVTSRQLRRIPGVNAVAVSAFVTAGDGAPVAVEPCSTVVQILAVSHCSDGATYIAPFAGQLKPGGLIHAGGHTLRVPRGAHSIQFRPVSTGRMTWPGYEESSLEVDSLVFTPAAAARLGLNPRNVTAAVRFNPDVPDSQDRLSDAVARIDSLAEVYSSVSSTVRDSTLQHLKRVLVAGAAAVLLVIGASLLVSVAEQLRERRRVLAVLCAFGARRSTLGWSVVWQTLLPVGIGLILALGLGLALGAVLMRVVSLPVSFDWSAIALLVGVGAAVIAFTTALTLPLLWRQMRPDALRAE